MNRVAALSSLLVLPVAALAVYAPIPPLEQGQAVTVTLDSSIYHDDNILGAYTAEIESWVFRFSPKVAYNESLGRNSFLNAFYKADALFFDNRPSDDKLLNHHLGAKLFYTFDESSELVVSNYLSFIDNPVSVVAGFGGQTNLSLKQNLFDAKVNGNFTETLGAAVKLRHQYISYDAATLSNLLDREEWTLGLEGIYKQSETTKLVGELRYQDINYDVQKIADSKSAFLLAGVDYDLTEVTSLSSRIGIERRQRASTPGKKKDSNFYGEVVGVHRYTTGSFLSGGLRYSTTATDSTDLYADQDSLLVFLNVQHMVTGAVTVSASISYDRSDLNPRKDLGGIPEIEDRTLRLGFAASYLVSENFSVSATLDIDRVSSDVFYREQDRTRFGISARYAFGFAP